MKTLKLLTFVTLLTAYSQNKTSETIDQVYDFAQTTNIFSILY